MKQQNGRLALVALFACAVALAQPAPPEDAVEQEQTPPPGHGPRPEGPPPPQANRPPMERAFHGGPPGRWWNNPELSQKLGLTADQQKRMDDIFQQSRLKLIDLNASLQKEEVVMEPLMAADQPDESKILSQIDRVAQARAELEKANARMLLGIRRVLNQEQWKKLQAETPPPAGRLGDRRPPGR
jgi:protein CpxP